MTKSGSGYRRLSGQGINVGVRWGFPLQSRFWLRLLRPLPQHDRRFRPPAFLALDLFGGPAVQHPGLELATHLDILLVTTEVVHLHRIVFQIEELRRHAVIVDQLPPRSPDHADRRRAVTGWE